MQATLSSFTITNKYGEEVTGFSPAIKLEIDGDETIYHLEDSFKTEDAAHAVAESMTNLIVTNIEHVLEATKFIEVE